MEIVWKHVSVSFFENQSQPDQYLSVQSQQKQL